MSPKEGCFRLTVQPGPGVHFQLRLLAQNAHNTQNWNRGGYSVYCVYLVQGSQDLFHTGGWVCDRGLDGVDLWF